MSQPIFEAFILRSKSGINGLNRPMQKVMENVVVFFKHQCSFSALTKYFIFPLRVCFPLLAFNPTVKGISIGKSKFKYSSPLFSKISISRSVAVKKSFGKTISSDRPHPGGRDYADNVPDPLVEMLSLFALIAASFSS